MGGTVPGRVVSGRGRALGVAALALAVAAVGCRPGVADTGFDGDGRTVVAGVGGPVSVAAEGDGVVVGGGGTGLVRLREDGTVDPAWQAPYPVPCPRADDVDRDPLGRFVVVCHHVEGSAGVADAVRFRADGTLDPAFGDGGVLRLPGLASSRLAPLPQGGYLAAGDWYAMPQVPNPVPTLGVVVVDADGQDVEVTTAEQPELPPVVPVEDRWFLTTVVVPTSTGAAVAVNLSFPLVSSGVPVGGAFIQLYDAAGRPVRRIEGPTPPGDVGATSITALAELPPGRLAAAAVGRGLVLSPPQAVEVGSASLAVHDTGTGNALVGANTRTPSGASYTPTALLPAPGGRLLVGGGTGASGSSRGVVARYDDATLELDAGFGQGGMVTPSGFATVGDLAPRTDGPSQAYASGTTPAGEAIVLRFWA